MLLVGKVEVSHVHFHAKKIYMIYRCDVAHTYASMNSMPHISRFFANWLASQ